METSVFSHPNFQAHSYALLKLQITVCVITSKRPTASGVLMIPPSSIRISIDQYSIFLYHSAASWRSPPSSIDITYYCCITQY